MESFEFPGVWWIPTDPENRKLTGPLTFDPKAGGKLSLTFEDVGKEHDVFGDSWELCIPIVHGKMDGRKVTLTRCHMHHAGWQNKDDARDAGTQTLIVWTDTVYLGVHFISLLDIKFEWMSVSYTHMNKWLGIERFPFNADGRTTQGVEVPLYNDLKILFYRATYEEIGENRVPNPHVLVAEIVADENMPYESHATVDGHETRAFHPYIDRYLRDFLNIVAGKPNYPFNISCMSPYDSKQLVKVFYRIPGYDPDTYRRVEVSFTVDYELIQLRFPSLLKTWIEKSMALRSASDLYFKRYYLSNIDVETQFIFLVQAVEAYHRSLHKDVYIEPDDYEPLREILELVITFQVKAEFVQTWSHHEYDAGKIQSLMQKLNDTIKHGNQYSLRKRLNVIRSEILKGNQKIVKEMLENPSDFVNRVAETRHFLTHRLLERNEHVLKRSEFPDYVRKLRKLLRLCFLVEMGLEPEEIEILSQYYPVSAL